MGGLLVGELMEYSEPHPPPTTSPTKSPRYTHTNPIVGAAGYFACNSLSYKDSSLPTLPLSDGLGPVVRGSWWGANLYPAFEGGSAGLRRFRQEERLS